MSSRRRNAPSRHRPFRYARPRDRREGGTTARVPMANCVGTTGTEERDPPRLLKIASPALEALTSWYERNQNRTLDLEANKNARPLPQSPEPPPFLLLLRLLLRLHRRRRNIRGGFRGFRGRRSLPLRARRLGALRPAGRAWDLRPRRRFLVPLRLQRRLGRLQVRRPGRRRATVAAERERPLQIFQRV